MRKSISSIYSGFISTSVITKIITFLCIIMFFYGASIFRNLLLLSPVDSATDVVPDTSSLEWNFDDLYAYDGELNKEILRIYNEPFLDFLSAEMIVSREKELINNIRNDLLGIQNKTDSFSLVLHRQSEAYINQLESKLRLVERYVASLRSYRAFEKIFPIIKKQLLNDIRHREIDNSSGYQSLVESIYDQVQRFIVSPDPQRRDNILVFIKKSEVKLNSISPVFENANEFILKSTGLIESKTLNDELLNTLFSASMSAYREIKITLNNIDSTIDKTTDFDVLHGQIWTLASLFAMFVICICYFLGYAAKQTFLLSLGGYQPIDRLGLKGDRHSKAPAKGSADMLGPKALNNSNSDKSKPESTLESLAMTLSHQIQTPLQHVNDNINALCPILEKVHATFDRFEKDSAEGVTMPDSIMSLIQSSAIAEFPFAVSEIKRGMVSAHMAAHNIRQLSKRKAVGKTRFNLNEAVTHVVKMKATSLRSIVDVKLKLSLDAPIVSAVKIDIYHMLDCLITNAIESMDKTRFALGKIEIATVIQDNVIKLLVRDNGLGMSKEILEKVYDPFFTTKKIEPGVGVGLTMVKRHVELYGGKIDIVSEKENGTIVRIVLPYCLPERKKLTK